MNRIYSFFVIFSLCLLVGCRTSVPTSIEKIPNETITYYVKTVDGKDFTHITLPKDIPDETKADRIKKMIDPYAQGDTIYYIKNETGLDSVLLKIPKGIPNEEKRRIESHVIQMLEMRSGGSAKDSIIEVKTHINSVKVGEKIYK